MLRLRHAILVACVAGALAPGPALADGDPASDFLLVRDTFLPYQPLVSQNTAAALNTTVARAKAAGYPIKVALIASPNDLGAVPNLFGLPQRYATFLDSEIAFNGKPRLLVVMPAGFGTVLAPVAPLRGLSVDTRAGSDGLARAAIQAVVLLARAAGHPFSPPPIPKASSKSGGSSTALVVLGPVILVLLAALGSTLARRRRGGEE